MYHVDVADDQSQLQVDPEWVADVVRKTLAAQEVAAAEIEIALLDDAAIHVVNREHLEHDYPTDVISFLYSSTPGVSAASSELRGSGCAIEGEVLVSTQTALRMSTEAGWSTEAEVMLYIIHGLLHLCGYDDLTAEEQTLMRARERAVLQIWNLTPHYHS
ncbi:rRNA maturation RNase YbeY [Planctomicrobium sp. SH661]|uniref:rRNA maturation RNase YbeY n=1 Tax=Planctomicrobium sp. SH661 TaxID=3448124 RepID=UPI003F5B3EF4